MAIVKITKRFYDDCVDCETAVPPIVRETKAHYFIDTDRPDPKWGEPITAQETLDDFKSRALYYSDPEGFEPGYLGLIASAKATLKAMSA
jgi:hypothetical protein